MVIGDLQGSGYILALPEISASQHSVVIAHSHFMGPAVAIHVTFSESADLDPCDTRSLLKSHGIWDG